MFADDDIEQAAQLILDSEGVINPIVVSRISLQSYEVVDGDFEYYAAARAREINPRKGEMIGVFIIEPENQDNLTKQVQVFRKAKSDSSEKINFTSKDLDKFLNNLESRFEKITKQLLEESTAKVKLETENKELKKQLADKFEALEVFKNLDVDKIAKKLINAGFNQKKANQIALAVVDERKKKQFKSLHDVIERVKVPHGKNMQKGISSKKMLDFIESLSVED